MTLYGFEECALEIIEKNNVPGLKGVKSRNRRRKIQDDSELQGNAGRQP